MDQVRGQWFVSVEEGKASSRTDKGPGRSGVHHRSIDRLVTEAWNGTGANYPHTRLALSGNEPMCVSYLLSVRLTYCIFIRSFASALFVIFIYQQDLQESRINAPTRIGGWFGFQNVTVLKRPPYAGR